MSHFNPSIDAPQFDASSDKRIQMNGLKSSSITDLRVTEVCMKKCNVALTPTMEEAETSCLRQCFVKFFDANLVIENEMTNFVRGMPM